MTYRKKLLILALAIILIISLFITYVQSSSVLTTKKIAYVKSNNIWLMKANGTGKQKLTNFGSNVWITNLAWAPSGNKIAFIYSTEQSPYDGQNQLLTLDLATSQVSSNLAGNVKRVASLNWRSDTNIIFSGLTDTTQQETLFSYIYTLDLSNSGVSQLISENAIEPRLSPNKSKLAYVAYKKTSSYSGSETLRYLNLVSSATKTIRKASYMPDLDGRSFNDPRFSPNGRKIIVHSTGSDVSGGVYTYSLTGRRLSSFYTSATNQEAYGYAEFLYNNWIIYKSMTFAAPPYRYYLRISKPNGRKARTVKRGQFAVWADNDLSIKGNQLLFATYNNNRQRDGHIYLFNLKTKRTKILATRAGQPTWQP